MVLAVGMLVGLVNGVGIAVFGISPIVMTLAMNGILQGLALIYSQGTPAGFSSPLMRWFMTDKSGIVTPVVVFVVIFVAVAVILLTRTAFGRRLYAIGNGERVAALSGIAVDRTIILRLHAVRLLLGAASAHADRLFGPGEPRDGRRISPAFDRRGGGRRRADHRRPRPAISACSAACCC